MSTIEKTVEAALPKAPRHASKGWGLAALLTILLWWAFAGTQFDPVALIQGLPKMGDMANRAWPASYSLVVDPGAYELPQGLTVKQLVLPVPLSADKAQIKEAWWENTWPNTLIGGTTQTIQMAVAGTVLAALIAFPLGFLAARNTSPAPWVYVSVKSVNNFLRSIPDFAAGLVLISAVGLGAFTGTLALTFGTATVLVKLFSEAIEAIDEGVVEAIQATGANRLQIYSFAVVPQIMPSFLSFAIYRFESNIRAATVLGLIGAGGIGELMTTYFRMFQYQEAAMTVIVLIVLVMIVDFTSAKLRKLVI
ncbi:MAG: phosphonate ABC transporter, permease protein PhnE [Cyanobacteria bacterium REEB65]|nr:phosphonate ABC transporter, permease protein PhnE [Cyanobacteria bacterium REEB65]